MNYLEQIKASIKKTYKDKPVVGDLCLAQAILESGLAKDRMSKLASECHNLFGIKDTDKKGYKEYWTTECSKGVCRKVVQNFECYKDFDSCIAHHKWLMQRPRYVKVWNAKTIKEAVIEVWKAGYATDPKYPDKLLSVLGDYK